MGYATCSVSTEHIEQQSNRATEHSAGHVTQRSAGLGSWSQQTSLPPDLLPEASLHPYGICTNATEIVTVFRREPLIETW